MSGVKTMSETKGGLTQEFVNHICNIMSEPKERELRECPFCGGNDANVTTNAPMPNFRGYFVMCKCCFCCTFVFDTKEKAIAAWNFRVAPVAEWTTEVKEAGMYIYIERYSWKKNLFTDPAITRVVKDKNDKLYIDRNGTLFEVQHDANSYWYKITLPALPGEGGSE